MCHKFQENRCFGQHLREYCGKGWHVRENDRRTNDYYNEPPSLDEKPQTPEPEETESEGSEARRKRIRCGRSGSEEAELQIALTKLKLGTDMPDEATLDHTYREKMTEIANSVPGAELPDKCSELTQAFRLVKSHLGLL